MLRARPSGARRRDGGGDGRWGRSAIFFEDADEDTADGWRGGEGRKAIKYLNDVLRE